nr:hypothetical protein Iba_chr08dCG11240 [Ipomoea batatas]
MSCHFTHGHCIRYLFQFLFSELHLHGVEVIVKVFHLSSSCIHKTRLALIKNPSNGELSRCASMFLGQFFYTIIYGLVLFNVLSSKSGLCFLETASRQALHNSLSSKKSLANRAV